MHDISDKRGAIADPILVKTDRVLNTCKWNFRDDTD